ncbi:MAG: bifunctional molybdenum cofactor biosynthesis protein MoaC/MoaB [Leptospiraceae bacterium]|nr:bifunctional molybdenum cofactor biosynthesis protein MoaC/MoaB [Leptospiraceae bacterium]
MIDISDKHSSLREAKASGLVVCSKETITRVKSSDLPKGDLFNVAKAAGLLASKQTHLLIPHCHPIFIDSLQIEFQILENYSDGKGAIQILVQGKSIHKTGIEMELLTSVSVTALTIYDLLKPIDLEMEISEIKLLEKKGGKSDKKFKVPKNSKSAILVCSDSTSKKEREDKSGKIIQKYMDKYKVEVVDLKIVSDDIEMIQKQIQEWVNQKIHFIFVTGGTGLGPRDNTIEAVKPLLEKEVPGIAEAMRSHGFERTPWAMLSRTIAGITGESLIVTLPGSSNGAKESLDAILPGAFHALNMILGGGH